MLQSMTGFGRVSRSAENISFLLEVKCLNGKAFDVRLRLPTVLRYLEPEIRKYLSQNLMRGKVELSAEIEGEYEEAVHLNKAAFKTYYNDIMEAFGKDTNVEPSQVLGAVMRGPDIWVNREVQLSAEQEMVFFETLTEVTSKVQSFRNTEGKAMADDLLERVDNIYGLLPKVEQYEAERKAGLQERLNKLINEHIGREDSDYNRMEQELIYYLDKMDFTEEKIRLAQHCKFFSETVNAEEVVKGQKLNFISQEMGREINTLGSKANHSEIQKIVVAMKDELSKIREQLANIV